MKVNIEGLDNYSSLKEAISALVNKKADIEVLNDSDSQKLVFKPKKSSVNIPLQEDGTVSVKDFEEYARKQGIEVKRRQYRKQDELPHPELSAASEQNRRDVKYQARVSEEFDKRVREFCQKTGIQKKTLTEKAISQFIDNFDIDQ